MVRFRRSAPRPGSLLGCSCSSSRCYKQRDESYELGSLCEVRYMFGWLVVVVGQMLIRDSAAGGGWRWFATATEVHCPYMRSSFLPEAGSTAQRLCSVGVLPPVTIPRASTTVHIPKDGGTVELTCINQTTTSTSPPTRRVNEYQKIRCAAKPMSPGNNNT